jgi:sulfur carrier protein
MRAGMRGFFILQGLKMKLKVILNGNSIEIQSGHNIESLVIARGLEPSRVVVELNGDITNSMNWTKTMLKENDNIELISFMGGG